VLANNKRIVFVYYGACPMSATLILLRHGQSVWNKKNIFTGWVDVDLSDEGRLEAQKAKKLLKNYIFDVVFTSRLKRAQETADIVIGAQKPLIISDAALNERSYGELEGKNKDEVRARFGLEQVEKWRRSLYEKPPGGESLAETCARVLPFYEHYIKPYVNDNKTVLIAAHGNSLRALVKHLDGLSEKELLTLEIPTGKPLIYEFDANKKAHRKLGV
jgi:2,3-bisphosphoglycerate-dependent phosphoglycerate mutase